MQYHSNMVNSLKPSSQTLLTRVQKANRNIHPTWRIGLGRKPVTIKLLQGGTKFQRAVAGTINAGANPIQ